MVMMVSLFVLLIFVLLLYLSRIKWDNLKYGNVRDTSTEVEFSREEVSQTAVRKDVEVNIDQFLNKYLHASVIPEEIVMELQMKRLAGEEKVFMDSDVVENIESRYKQISAVVMEKL